MSVFPSIGIIGAGAAGSFCAIELARTLPGARITVYEAGAAPLAKVAVTGGGRCNFTNTFEGVERLEGVYPRGAHLMRRALGAFGWRDTVDWFEREGVKATVQDDHCVFPASQDAMQIVHTLENLMRRLGVKLVCSRRIGSVEELDEDIVVLTAGGKSEEALRRMLPPEVKVTATVPSLYTLKIADPGLRKLMGTTVENVTLGIAGTSLRSSGTLLLTDWGVSGPATLRLSSYAARHLAENNWQGTLTVGWISGAVERGAERRCADFIAQMRGEEGRKMLSSTRPEGLSDRLWRFLLLRAGLREDLRWAELGSKGARRLCCILTSDEYRIEGRARFKEEFVTCGGVDLAGVEPGTCRSRVRPNLYFAGEVLDVDAVTGGFNLQAAWSTAMLAARSIAGSLKTEHKKPARFNEEISAGG